MACIYDRGYGVLKRVWGPGLHLKIPFWQIAKLFNAQIIEYNIRHGFDISNKESLGDEPVLTTTKDNKSISIEGSILFRIDKANAPQLWENVGENFVSKVIRPYARSRVSNVFTQFNASEISHSRTKIEQTLKEELNQLFDDKAIKVEGVLLSEVKILSGESHTPTKTILDTEK